ncbi:PepSY-associated TM helix domain-containing protein [Achromobacter pestifer]|uniref:PepSY domain-containing protein n=1 Tax=Achromobacter pestifer TaxID=1353889 RepID=A0A6S6Z856_9BURK|nr:PepSY-associated TM helix domain-containing protein [Achromobacter pestifer]CAB3654693.1 hypothetical protein LMG3431_03035 [Achromobacter pestifer]
MSGDPEGTLRARMAWLHSWAGLLLGWLAFAVFVTGALSVYAPEISRWMMPETGAAGRADRQQALRTAEAALYREAPRAARWQLELPAPRKPLLTLSWSGPDGTADVRLDPATGAAVVPRDTEGGDFLVEFHYSLHAGKAGISLVGACSLGLLLVLVTGIIVHRRLFADFFTFRPRLSAGRAWLDAHNVLGVLPLPFSIMILVTALSTLLLTYLPAGVHARFGNDIAAMAAQVFPAPPGTHAQGDASMLPLPELVRRAETVLGAGKAGVVIVREPGREGAIADVMRVFDDRFMAFPDRVSLRADTGSIVDTQNRYGGALTLARTLGGLHYGYYAAPLLRALYFALALAGAGMIATGLALYSVRTSARGGRFAAAVHRINVAMICGPLCACAAYFLANRLAWPGAAGLHDREVLAFFLAWAGCWGHAVWGDPARLWRRQWLAAAVLWMALVPVDAAALALQPAFRHLLGQPLHAVAASLFAAMGGLSMWIALRRGRHERDATHASLHRGGTRRTGA